MTSAAERAIADLGIVTERVIARSGSRAVLIGRREGERQLVSVLGPGLAGDARALEERPAWDLPLVGAIAFDVDGLPRTLLTEYLPAGEPPRELGPFARELALRVVDAHRRGEVVGPLHPALVFAEPGSGRLDGIAQRPLRGLASTIGEGEAPLFAASYRTPAELLGTTPTPADDVFRLAALLWRWALGTNTFGEGAEEIDRTLAGRPLVVPEGRLAAGLLRAFDPDPAARPTAEELVAFLDATAGGEG